MEGATEKIKNYQRFLYWLIEYMPKKEPKKSREILPLNGLSRQLLWLIMVWLDST
jgi:hypothetical protein